MRHLVRLLSSMGSALLLAVAVAAPAAAAPEGIPFEGVFYQCGFALGSEWFGGNVFHFRGDQNYNLWVTGNPLLDGPEVNVVNGDINVKAGRGIAHPRTTVYPTAYDGTWEIQIQVSVSGDGLTAHGQGYGTGELQGMSLSFSNPGDIAIDPADNPCSDAPFAVLIEGEILAPRGTP